MDVAGCRVVYDEEADCMFVSLRAVLGTNGTPAYTTTQPQVEELMLWANKPGMLLFDANGHGQVIGVEAHQASKWVPRINLLLERAADGVLLWLNPHCKCANHDRVALDRDEFALHPGSFMAVNPRRPRELCYIRIKCVHA